MKKRSLLLGVDIGSLSTKGVLTTASGQIIAQASKPHPLRHPQAGWVEHDPEQDWWGDFVAVTRNLVETARLQAGELKGVCVSGLFPVLCVGNAQGAPIRNAILYSDGRACSFIRDVEAVSGATLKGDETSPRWLWLREREPGAFRKARRLFSVPGYIVYHLTGENVIDPQTAFRMGGMVDFSRLRWRKEMLDWLEAPAEAMPKIRLSTDVVGQVTAAAAAATGLPEGAPVLAGMTDTLATMLGNGVIHKGDGMIYYGTTAYMSVCRYDLEDVIQDPALIGDDSPFVLAAYILNSGETLEWFTHLTHWDATDAPAAMADLYQKFDDGAGAIGPGCDGLIALPHFFGQALPSIAPQSRGGWLGLTTSHTRAHLWRALLEAIAYEIRRGVIALSERGIEARRVAASGGGAHSLMWKQIVSDVTNLPQWSFERGSAELGCAFLAGVATSQCASFASMEQDWLGDGALVTPRPQYVKAYLPLFARYCEVEEKLRLIRTEG